MFVFWSDVRSPAIAGLSLLIVLFECQTFRLALVIVKEQMLLFHNLKHKQIDVVKLYGTCAQNFPVRALKKKRNHNIFLFINDSI